MVRRIEFPSFKALLLTVALMPLVVLATGQVDYTLYFNDVAGKFHKNNEAGAIITDLEGVIISGQPGKRVLEFSNFIFETTAEQAIILTNNTTIMLNGSKSKITNTNVGGYGIVSSHDLDIKASRGGSLEIFAGKAGIKVDHIIVTGGIVTIEGGTYGIEGKLSEDKNTRGTLIAIGETRAISGDFLVPFGFKYCLEAEAEVTLSDGSFLIDGTHKYVKIQGLDPITDRVDITVTTPIAGMEAKVSIKEAFFNDDAWFPPLAEGKFEAGKQYTFSPVLTPHQGYVFVDGVNVYINGKPAKIESFAGNRLELNYQFGVTKTIGIKIGPDKNDVEIVDDIIRFNAACGALLIDIEVTADADITIGEENETQNIRYKMPLSKYGDNKVPMHLTFEEASRDYTIVVNKPIEFNYIIKQKWNKVLVVKNNDQAYGGFNFTEFKWFKNGKELLGEKRQFYAEPGGGEELLKSTDKFSVRMKTNEGMEVNTCDGYPDINNMPPAQKQVLGINGKAAPQNSEVYNTKGERASGKTPGVYIIRRTSK